MTAASIPEPPTPIGVAPRRVPELADAPARFVAFTHVLGAVARRLRTPAHLLAVAAAAATPGCSAGDGRAGDEGPAPSKAAVEPTGELTLEYLAHASFLVHTPGGRTVLLDPFQSRVWLGYDFPDVPEPDAVVVTHPHYDHDAGRFRGAPFPWPPEVPVLDRPGEWSVGDALVTGVEGKHADPYGKEFGQRNTLMVVEAAGVRLAHLGDNGPLTDENVNALGRVDVLLIPVDADEHILSHAEVDRIARLLAPKVLVPMHYRIPELEDDPGAPADLGGIEPWLEGRAGVVRVGRHLRTLAAADLPAKPEVWVFEPSPRIERAGGPR